MNQDALNGYRFKFSIFLLLAILSLLPQLSFSQVSIGLRWDIEGDEQQLSDDIQLINQINPAYLEISKLQDLSLLESISDIDSKVVYALTQSKFLINSYLPLDSTQVEEFRDFTEIYSSNELIDGYVLVKDSKSYDPMFVQRLAALTDALRDTTSRDFLIHHPVFYADSVLNTDGYESIYDIKTSDQINPDFKTVFFAKTAYEAGDEKVLNSILAADPEVLYLSLNWLKAALSANPEIALVLPELTVLDASLPVPNQPGGIPKPNWNVLLLILLWTTVITHYAYHPTYRTDAFRYFHSHNYFVKDVMEYRIRNTSNGIIILIQHAFVGGLFFYFMLRGSFSDTGFQSFFYNLPYITFLGDTYLSVFIFGVLVTLIFQIISILWISVFNSEVEHSSQILRLYSWPLQVNFVIITLMSALFQTDRIGFWFYTLAILYMIIWFNAFNFAAIDTAKFKKTGRTGYAFLTIVLHILLSGIAVAAILVFTPFLEAAELAAMLP